jgi:hypothetical protein
VGKSHRRLNLIAGQHEAAALHRDVAHRCDPGVAGIGGRRAVQLDALGVHRGAHQRQVVLPADDGAHPAERRLEHGHRRAVAEAPDQPLGRRGHNLAVLAQVGAVWCEEQDRAIERPAGALDDPDNEINSVSARRPGGRVTASPGMSTLLSQVPLEVVTAPLRPRADDGAEVEPSRIGRHEGFGKQDETRPCGPPGPQGRGVCRGSARGRKPPTTPVRPLPEIFAGSRPW